MKVLEKKLENQLQFWALLGPSMILLALCILLFKVSAHWYLALSAVIGIPLCLKWHMKGLIGAIGLLTITLVLSTSIWQLTDRYWFMGMGLAVACGWVVLTLSWKEVTHLIGQVQSESYSRLENFLLLDGKMKSLESAWSTEKETLKAHISLLNKDIADLETTKHDLHKLIQLTQDEILTLRTQHERLLDDLKQKKQCIAQLREHIDGTEFTLQQFVNGESEKQLQKLHIYVKQCEEELHISKQQHQQLNDHILELQQEKTKLAHELQNLVAYEAQIQHRYQHEQTLQQARLQQQEEKIQELLKEQTNHNQTIKQLQVEMEHYSLIEKRMRQEGAQLQDIINQKEREISTLQEQKRQVEYALEQQSQKMHREHTDVQVQEDPIYATQPIASLYKQLRLQFEEKTAMLDTTRRELFYSQEHLTAMEKEWQEQTVFSINTNEVSFEKYIAQLIQEQQEQEAVDQEEIALLHELIADLIASKSSKLHDPHR